MGTRPGQINPVDAVPQLAKVLESLGYTVKERNTAFAPCDVFALHKTNLPIIVNVFSNSIEVACHLPCTEHARQNPEEFLAVVNSMNALCRLATCQADPEYLTIRTCFPFAFEPDLFRSFMEAWMDDAGEVLADIRRQLGYLESGFVQ